MNKKNRSEYECAVKEAEYHVQPSPPPPPSLLTDDRPTTLAHWLCNVADAQFSVMFDIQMHRAEQSCALHMCPFGLAFFLHHG